MLRPTIVVSVAAGALAALAAVVHPVPQATAQEATPAALAAARLEQGLASDRFVDAAGDAAAAARGEPRATSGRVALLDVEREALRPDVARAEQDGRVPVATRTLGADRNISR